MNNTFDLNRFGLLIRKQWLEYGKLYLITLATVAGILISIYGFFYWQIVSYHTNPFLNDTLQLDFRWPLFVLFGILFLSLSANHYFAPLGQKPKAILELTLPASSLEKFIVGVIFSSFFALLSYLLIFYLVDLAFVSKLRAEFPTAVTQNYVENPERILRQQVPQYFLSKILTKPELRFTLFSGPILLSSVFLLGSLFFRKFQYIKTIISTMVFLGIWITFLVYSINYMFDNKTLFGRNDNWNMSKDGMEWILIALLFAFSIFNWTIAYVRFKEKEV